MTSSALSTLMHPGCHGFLGSSASLLDNLCHGSFLALVAIPFVHHLGLLRIMSPIAEVFSALATSACSGISGILWPRRAASPRQFLLVSGPSAGGFSGPFLSSVHLEVYRVHSVPLAFVNLWISYAIRRAGRLFVALSFNCYSHHKYSRMTCSFNLRGVMGSYSHGFRAVYFHI